MSLYEYFGDTCPHCIEMRPMVEKLEHELGVSVEKREVWNNDENAKILEGIDNGLCGGVPFFYDDVRKTFICGATDEATMRAWMKGEKADGIGVAK